MAMNKKYYWQKTKVCEKCHFNDDPGACHYYGYRIWPELELADDCWQFLTEEQWKELETIGLEKARLERWDQIRHRNHPELPQDYQPDYKPKLMRDPSEVSDKVLKWHQDFKD